MNQYCESTYNIPVIRFENTYTLNPGYIYGLNRELVHFHNNRYHGAFKKLQEKCHIYNNLSEGGEIDNINSSKNLIKNSNFADNLNFWSYSNCCWTVKNDKENNRLVPTSKANSRYKWIWCDPIEINDDGNTAYTLSFSIICRHIPSTETFSAFGIRTFKKAVEKVRNQCIYAEIVQIPSEKIECQKEFRYSYTFYPTGKFIRVAPHVKNDVCDIEFTKIQLEKGKQPTDYKTASEDREQPYFTVASTCNADS